MRLTRLALAARRLVLAAALAGLASPALAAAEESACVACHRGVHDVAYLEHDFSDWQKSAHARVGVSCSACHGGNPTRPDKAAAHAGMLASTDAASRVYFTQVPATCGNCHEQEFGAFKTSAHYHSMGASVQAGSVTLQQFPVPPGSCFARCARACRSSLYYQACYSRCVLDNCE